MHGRMLRTHDIHGLTMRLVPIRLPRPCLYTTGITTTTIWTLNQRRRYPQLDRSGGALLMQLFPTSVLPNGQFARSLGSPSLGGLSYDELARHHAWVRALRKPELVAECHQLRVPGNINVAKAMLQSRLLACYRNQLQRSDGSGGGAGSSDAHGA